MRESAVQGKRQWPKNGFNHRRSCTFQHNWTGADVEADAFPQNFTPTPTEPDGDQAHKATFTVDETHPIPSSIALHFCCSSIGAFCLC